jgi:hypothetical protein
MKGLMIIGILAAVGGALCAQPPSTLPSTTVGTPATSRSDTTGHSPAHPAGGVLQKQKRAAEYQLHLAENQLRNAQAVVKELRQHLEKQTGRSDEKGVIEVIRELEGVREKALLARTMKSARTELLQKKILVVSAEIADKSERDKITKELQTIVAQKERDVATLEKLGNQVALRDVDVAQSEAAEARIRLHTRREAVLAVAYGDTLRTLNKELVDVSLDAEEQAVLVTTVDERLKTLRQGRDTCDLIQFHEEKAKRLQAEVDRLAAAYRELDAASR